MKKILFFIILFLSLFFTNAQSENWVKYLELKNKGIEEYNTNNFKRAEEIFEKMLALKSNFIFFNDLHYYVLCLIKNEKIDESKPYLFQLVSSNCFDINYFNNATFDKIKQTEFWDQIDSTAQIHGIKCTAFIDSLVKMIELDQAVRKAFQYATLKEEQDTLRKTMLELDNYNSTKLSLLIEKYGFPTWHLVGINGCHDAWLIAQHAKFEFREWFMIEYQNAVNENNAEKKHLAYLIDRNNLWKKKPQIYGTQGSYPDSVQPIEDIENLNFRREEMNLPPLYIEKMKIADEIWQHR
jgi:hypothetical protein